MTEPVRPRLVVDLTVSFGNQTRFKCRVCTKFVHPDAEVRCACGSVYAQQSDGRFEVIEVPDV